MTPPTSTAPRAPRWPVFAICWLALLADGYDLVAYGATLPSLQAHPTWDVSTTAAAAVGALALFGVMIGAIAIGTLTDRFGRKRLLMLCVALFSLGMLGCALAPTFAVFSVLRLVTGIGIGGLIPTAVAIVAEFAEPRRRSRTLGLAMTGVSLGGVAASLVALGLLADFGFRPVYGVGAVSLLLIVPAARLLPESVSFLRLRGRHREADVVAARFALPADIDAVTLTADADGQVPAPSVGASLRRLFARGYFWPTIGFWVVLLANMLTNFGISTWLPQALRGAGFGLGSALTFLLAYTAGAVIGTLVGATVADRVGAKTVGAVAFAVGALGLAALGFLHVTGLLLTAVAVAGLGIITTQVMINDHVAGFYPPASRATGLGWALGVGRIGAIAGPAYGALALTSSGGSLTTIALLFAAPAILGAAVLAVLPRRAPSSRRAPDPVTTVPAA